jgi:predicted RNA binding protein YcfA (HicA-like mRNA interferase family)
MTLKDQVEKRKRRVIRYATAKELLHFLRKHGYEETRQMSSHRILTHAVRPMLVVPEVLP